MSTNGSLAKASLPYAEALFESSQLIQLVEKTSQDLKFINDTISKSLLLRNFLSNPLIIPDAKKKVLENLFTDQIGSHVFNFLFILVERRRISLLNSIIDTYLILVYQLELTTVVEIYSSLVLTEIQKKALEKKLQVMTNSKAVKLVLYIKPELIGGFVVKIGSKVIDMSISGQLSQIASYLNVARL
uniref:ATP synthase subunit delta, chloroplastic n=1 Tax=Calliarthron tuberculosum TaxID=48942 RepID=M4IV78_CALTB|nr:ATP synthase delta chain [Calliarthron tuberculosum]AGA63887.1 ATP synthase delta chain [Calliarthron tuberculosum]